MHKKGFCQLSIYYVSLLVLHQFVDLDNRKFVVLHSYKCYKISNVGGYLDTQLLIQTTQSILKMSGYHKIPRKNPWPVRSISRAVKLC